MGDGHVAAWVSLVDVIPNPCYNHYCHKTNVLAKFQHYISIFDLVTEKNGAPGTWAMGDGQLVTWVSFIDVILKSIL